MLLNLYGLTPYGQEGIVQSSVKNNRTARWNWIRGVLKVVFASTLLLLPGKAG